MLIDVLSTHTNKSNIFTLIRSNLSLSPLTHSHHHLLCQSIFQFFVRENWQNQNSRIPLSLSIQIVVSSTLICSSLTSYEYSPILSTFFVCLWGCPSEIRQKKSEYMSWCLPHWWFKNSNRSFDSKSKSFFSK